MRKILLNYTVLVAALGYFVDMFDLTLFGVVRVSSLKSLGLTDPGEILVTGVHLLNWQMFGMLVGGILWGILGDKKGRLSVLFGSILLYSLANIANAFVWDVQSYTVLRFIAGIGLAGELGAAITLVSESLSPEERGYGTTLIATIGLLGAVMAALVGQKFSWQSAYLVGGCLGLILLAARFQVLESGMFQKSLKNRGNILLLNFIQRNNIPSDRTLFRTIKN
jgi:MFS family permease